MPPTYLIDPHKGVGPIRFGMPRADLPKILGEQPLTMDRRDEGYELFDSFRRHNSLQVFYDPSEHVVAVQFPKFDDVVYPPDVTMMDRTYEEVLAWARTQDPDLVVLDEYSFRSDPLGIVASCAFDEPELKWLMVYRPHYYEDAERWLEELEAKIAAKKSDKP